MHAEIEAKGASACRSSSSPAAAAFFGSNLVAALCARGTHRVVVSDHFGNDSKWQNLRSSPVDEIVLPADLPAWLAAHAGQLEAVLHFGSHAGTVETDVAPMLDSNVAASIRLWEWCA